MRILIRTLVVALAWPLVSFAWYTVTNGLDPAELAKGKVKIAVVKVTASRLVKPEKRERLPNGAVSYTYPQYSIGFELIEQLYGTELVQAELTNVSFCAVKSNNAWPPINGSPKGRHFIMAWRYGSPCGQCSGVRFWPGPDLPVVVDGPNDPVVTLFKQLLQIVTSPKAGDKRADVDKKLKEIRAAVGMRVGGIDFPVESANQKDSNPDTNRKHNKELKATGEPAP